MSAAKPSKADLPWLRPVAIVAITGLHLAAVYHLAIPTKAIAGAENPVELTIAAEEPAPSPPPPPPEPETPPPPAPPPPKPPEPDPEPVPEPPKKLVEAAPALPPPPPKPKPQPPQKQPPKPLPPQPEAPPPPPEPQKQPDPAEDAARAAAAAQAKLTYGDKVVVELRRHRVRSTARSKAQVAFALNEKGEVASARIVQSSGNEELDEAILRSVHAINPGPPPDGSFEATWWITVRD